jgi:hypothetical protein
LLGPFITKNDMFFNQWTPSATSAEKVWTLQMLAGCVRMAGSALLPFLSRLEGVVVAASSV